jgi:alpha-amylase/alpha-mannosidase (GH57 family)
MTTRTYSNLLEVDRFVCIHGHFYQPPRENAWLERIERQESAHPFRDWNERIDAECYRPNARARILDGEDRIATLANNYARINFNFGPTLLSWMETHARRTYEGVLAADAESIKRFGHGSAMAQAYGHLILPLASERDRRTQVRWGIRDFEHRFGRKPEGMWLPETAACTDSLRALAEEGIKFTILSPRQAKAIRKKGQDKLEEVNEGTLDTRRPYFVDLGAGRRIAVFFYDGATSQAIAFEHLLSSGDAFAGRLLGRLRGGPGPELVHVATDGETYGHHHRFGEMALAYALDRIETSGKARLTNYATYLAQYPPEDEAVIVERSSWSCAHGVGRWSADCGCRMRGDSNQAWRGPLRKALDKLRDRIDDLYEESAEGLLADPWAARDAYIDVVLDRSEANVRAFLERHVKGSAPESHHRALELCELQRQRMLMFTSCGWFFDDVNGLETTQILQYAARAVELASSVSGVALEPARPAHPARARCTRPPSAPPTSTPSVSPGPSRSSPSSARR